MRCPSCGAETPDAEWNCTACRMNVYWASQHFDALARARAQQGLSRDVETPEFLRQAHRSAMSERSDTAVLHKVRRVARLVMATQARPAPEPDGAGIGGGSAVEDRPITVSDKGSAD
jgi:hypothetical protein